MAIESSLADLLTDDEALYRTICYYKKHIYQLYDERRQAMESKPDAWTVWHENHYKNQIVENLTQLDYFSRHLQNYTACAAKDSQTAKKLLPNQDQDNQKLRTQIDQKLDQAGAQIQDTQSTDAEAILEKKTVVCPTYNFQINRRPMKKNAARDKVEIVNLVIPPPPCRVRFVYRDNPEAPIANGQVLCWTYDNLPAREGKIENHTIRFTKFTSRMTPMGVCVTGPDGYALPAAPFYGKDATKFGFDEKEGTMGISCKLDKSMIQKIAQGIKDTIRLYTAPVENLLDYSQTIAQNIKDLNIDQIVNSDFIQSLTDPKKQWQGTGAVWPYEHIATTMAIFGATDEDVQLFSNEEKLNLLTRLEPDQKLPELSQQYFQSKRTYGFMAYPAYQGAFMTQPVDQIAKIETGDSSAPEGAMPPDNPGCALWKGPLDTGKLKITNSMYTTTIALHCTLPQWDRRLNDQLKTLDSAGQAYRLSVKGHVANLHRVRSIKEAVNLYTVFPFRNLSEKERTDCKNLREALQDLEHGIGDQMQDPKDHSQYCGIADAAKELKKQGQILNDMLLSPAFCDELARYMEHTFGDKDGIKDNQPAPGPYMQIEPHWNNIFLTMAKCYVALKETEFGDQTYTDQVKGFLFKIAKEAAKLDMTAGELEKELGDVTRDHMIEPDKRDHMHNQLAKLLPRIADLQEVADEIPEFETTGPLKIIKETFLKANETFLRTPGPPAVAEALLDAFYDYLFKDIAKMSRGNKSFHILIVFGFLKWTVRIRPDEVILFKRFYYRYIRAHGRAVQPGKLKKNLRKLLTDAKDGLRKWTDKKFPNRPPPGKGLFSDHVYEKNITQIGSTAHGYKVFCQLLSLSFTVEALRNMNHEDAQDSSKSVIYTAKKIEMIGALGIGSMCAMRTANKWIISVDPSWSFVKTGAENIDDFWKSKKAWLDFGGTALAFISSAVASMEAYHAYHEKGDSKQALKKSIEAIGEFALAAGHVMQKELVKKAAQKVAQKVGLRLTARIVGSLVCYATPVGVVLTVGMILYDIACLLEALGRSNMDVVVKTYWEKVLKSKFETADNETKYYRKTYFNAELKETFDRVDTYHTDSGLFDVSGVSWEYMNWRAVVPMYKMGFSTETIEKSIQMDEEVPSYEDMRHAHATRAAIFTNRIRHDVYMEWGYQFNATHDKYREAVGPVRVPKASTIERCQELDDLRTKGMPARVKKEYEKQFKEAFSKVPEEKKQELNTINKAPMNIQAIIDYYIIVSDTENQDKQFVYSDNSRKSYAEVAKELSNGSFIPSQQNHEDLPLQKACKNVHSDAEKLNEGQPRNFRELISHTWDHDMFRKFRKM